MHFSAVIPARYASVRFPAKALAQLDGKPIIQHVYEAVSGSGLFDEVLVATDAPEIIACVNGFGGRAVLTSVSHQSGSDRIAEAIRDIPTDVVINVQGDEPLIDTQSLSLLKSAFDDGGGISVASLMTPIQDMDMLIDPNIVKVICDNSMNAIYFSRSVIPYNRDGISGITYYRHIGVYAFRKEALLRFVELPMGELESIEKLEQLRLLQNGIPIRMICSTYQGIGIDTPSDLIRVEKIIKERGL